MKSNVPGTARVLLILATATLPAGSTGAAQTAIDSIRNLDTAWGRAYAVHDTTLAQSLFARDIIITNSTGSVKTRDQELADFRRSPDLVMRYFRTEDVSIHQFGDNAVVVGNAQWEFTMGGQNRTLRRRYTARYTRGGPLGWQMVALHLFTAPPAAPAANPVAVSASAGVDGRWEGRLGASGLRLLLDIVKTPDSLYFGTMTSIDQGGARFPIDRIRHTGDSVHLELGSVGGRYNGVISADRTKLTGTWIQGGRGRLEFTRSAQSAAPEPATSAAASPFGVPAQLTVPVRPTLFTGNGKRHLAYEIHVVNHSGGELRLTRLEVLDPTATLARFEGAELNAIVAQRRTNVTDNRALPPGSWAVLFVWVTLDSAARAPRSIRHRLTAGGQTLEGTIAVASPPPIVVGPPLRGADWVARNGPDNIGGHHRRALVPIDGRVTIAQRFAIDWAKLGTGARLFDGDERDNKSYFSYGADVIAVADGVVASIKDGIPENVPGATSRAVPITMETVAGNYVILDLGQGRYAFYAHLIPGSLRVKVGDRIRREQLLGRVGNSGNSTGPHLHFHIADANLPLNSEGLPYAIDTFELLRSPDTWERRTNEIPMYNVRVRFPSN